MLKIAALLIFLTTIASAEEMCVTSTAYCLRGRTSSGTCPQMGTVSVDPRFIPLGSRIYVPGYGWGRALDTGVRGRNIDIWLPSAGHCRRWGRRQIVIRYLRRG